MVDKPETIAAPRVISVGKGAGSLEHGYELPDQLDAGRIVGPSPGATMTLSIKARAAFSTFQPCPASMLAAVRHRLRIDCARLGCKAGDAVLASAWPRSSSRRASSSVSFC